MRERLLSGIKPSGKLHLGNYLGAIQNFIDLQNKYESYFAIVDLHSLTEKFDPKQKTEETLDLAIDFLALGLDPAKCTIFVQSQVLEHAELSWIFSCLTPVGELERMTQYKDFVGRGHSANAGLLTYPILQAADILIYHAAVVPIGEDQLQHLELANDIAKKFNSRFGETFTPVKPLLTKTPRVMSILEPSKKMSKSLGDRHVINLNDEPEVIEKKLARAVTDTGKTKTMSAGTKNLFALLEIFGEPEQYKFYLEQHKAGSIRYSDLKANLAKVIAHHFADYRRKRKELEKQPERIMEILASGKEKARAVASLTLAEVKQKMGLM
ncbi:MAG: Tryptophan-tRNA ligase [Parcubacteria group bacterium GW2011_GWA2_52_8]|nr:MAG: Tryptophan-tRNA ligase [Parcubacteria group bacterium GW2011_GWA2_52_8]